MNTLRSFDVWARALHPDDRERMMGAARRRRKGFREEYRLIDPEGTVRHYLDYGAPQHDGRWIGAFRDITKSKQAENALARLAAIVQCSRDPIMSSDMDGVIQTWNPAAEKLYGYTAAEIVGRSLVTLYPPDRREAAPKLAEVLRGTAVWAYETEHMRNGGAVFPVSVVASPIKDAEGRVVGNSGIIRDITEHKRTQEALMESENRFRALVNNSNDVITLIDPDATILYDSTGVSELLGVSPEQRLGCRLFEWIHPGRSLPHAEAARGVASHPGRTAARTAAAAARGRNLAAARQSGNQPGRGAGRPCTGNQFSGHRGTEKRGDGVARERTAIPQADRRCQRYIFSHGYWKGISPRSIAVGEQLSGYSREELLGKHLQQFAPPIRRGGPAQAMTARRGGGNATALEGNSCRGMVTAWPWK